MICSTARSGAGAPTSPASTTPGPASPASASPSSAGPAAPAPLAYFDALAAALAGARTSNAAALDEASAVVADVVANDGIAYVFGSGHSQLVALEVSRRAGGLAPLQVIFDPRWGAAEHLEGYADTLLADVAFGPKDCLIAISNSGTTASPIETAERARAAGATVIAVTARAASAAAKACHSSGRRLFELADVTLDTGAAPNDAAISVANLAQEIGPVSTVVATALVHQVVVGAVARLADRGVEPPLYRRNAAEGGREHNKRLREQYRGRIWTVP